MAKKKATSKNKGINLLKGITGSNLAKLIAIIVVLLAIPLTVTSLKQQTNTQQEAAGSICGPCFTYVKATDSCRYKCTSGQVCNGNNGCVTKYKCNASNNTCTPSVSGEFNSSSACAASCRSSVKKDCKKAGGGCAKKGSCNVVILNTTGCSSSQECCTGN